ncbi:MAG: efflux RND transporter periplasmic adaptor subunit [Chromatiales bacterium]|jgi:RND family efflux transporter MFP subunit|nr:efflux RND transporter periplasmic adaptor subunit [Chromatiales bacterium]
MATEQRPSIARRLSGFLPIALGIAIVAWAVTSRDAPQRVTAKETGTAVRVVVVQARPFAARAVGFGSVRPGRVWKAVSQVNGRVSRVHERLRDGEFIGVGEELLLVDPADYQLNVAQVQAQLAELVVQEANTKASLAIEERNLSVAERELQRAKQLVSKGTSSRSAADSAERVMLSTRAAAQNMRNNLALIPSQRQALEARLAQAQRDLTNTRLVAPFAMRIAGLDAERDQYISVGQTLFEGDAIERVEITAQVPMGEIRRLFLGREAPAGRIDVLGQDVAKILGVTASVRLDMGDRFARWDAKVLRISDAIDADTRTLGVIVGVDKPWKKAIPGIRPPLTKGMYVEIELVGTASEPRHVIPRSAVTDGVVSIVDDDSRLIRQAVDVSFHQDDVAVLSTGLRDGQQIIVSNLVPALDGMLLEPHVDGVTAKHLSQAGTQP